MKVHPALCTGAGECHRWAPRVYSLGEDGCIDVRLLEVPPDLAEDAWLGSTVCPSQAITLIGPRRDPGIYRPPRPGSATTTATAQPPDRGERRRRSTLRAVALPTEHGGWSLTLEPALLGLALAPTVAGLCLAVAALLAFLARTPLKLVLLDRSRGRRLERTTVALRVATMELVLLAALLTATALLAHGPFWVPALAAAPLVAVELWFDIRARSRRLVPELAGAIGVSSVVAMIVLADAMSGRLAAGLWLLLTARVVSSIPFVRSQVAGLHGRATPPRTLLAADLAALAATAIAVGLDAALAPGAVAVVVLVVAQRVIGRHQVERAALLGAQQVVLGLTVVLVTALGVLAP